MSNNDNDPPFFSPTDEQIKKLADALEGPIVDEADIADLEDVAAAVVAAIAAARAGEREKFVFQVGFARGRLSRVSERIYQGGEFGERL